MPLNSAHALVERSRRSTALLWHDSNIAEKAWEHRIQELIAQQNGTKETFTDSREQSEMEAALEKIDPMVGSPAAGLANLFVDDLLWNRGKRNGTTCSDQT